MSVDCIGVIVPPPTDSPDFGTSSSFSRMTGVDSETAAYWVATVSRAAHRVGHPRLNIDGCPGCTFERAEA